MEFDCRATPLEATLEIVFHKISKATHWKVEERCEDHGKRLLLAGGGDPDELAGFTPLMTPLNSRNSKQFVFDWLTENSNHLNPDDEEVRSWRITNCRLGSNNRRAFVSIEPILEDCLK